MSSKWRLGGVAVVASILAPLAAARAQTAEQPAPDVSSAARASATAAPELAPPPPPSAAPEPPATQAAPPLAPAPAAAPTETAELAASSANQAESEPKFGDAGEVVLSGQLSASFGHAAYDNDASSTSFSLQPSFDYFVMPNVFVGAAALISYGSMTSSFGLERATLAFGGSGRVGGNVEVGEKLSFRPALSLGVWREKVTYTVVSSDFYSSGAAASVDIGADVAQTVVVASVFAPLLFHPASHFFIGLGPDISVDLMRNVASNSGGMSSNRRTFIGVSSVVGGWLDPPRR